MEEGHEIVANMMLGLVGLHIVGVIISSFAHQENLISGRSLEKNTVNLHKRFLHLLMLWVCYC